MMYTSGRLKDKGMTPLEASECAGYLTNLTFRAVGQLFTQAQHIKVFVGENFVILLLEKMSAPNKINQNEINDTNCRIGSMRVHIESQIMGNRCSGLPLLVYTINYAIIKLYTQLIKYAPKQGIESCWPA